MRYLPSDKYNVAWFKLAECVSRGEKERALGVYRLLAHSFDDRAYAAQLEGDILLSCDDVSGAVEKFKEAVQLYHKDGRMLQACALGEHVLSLAEDKEQCAALLLELYTILGMRSKIILHGQFLMNLSIKNNDLERALAIMDQIDVSCMVDETVALRKPLVLALCRPCQISDLIILAHLEKLIDGLLLSDDSSLQRFLIELADISEEYQAHAAAYVASR